jgi:hypothetical protein
VPSVGSSTRGVRACALWREEVELKPCAVHRERTGRMSSVEPGHGPELHSEGGFLLHPSDRSRLRVVERDHDPRVVDEVDVGGAQRRERRGHTERVAEHGEGVCTDEDAPDGEDALARQRLEHLLLGGGRARAATRARDANERPPITFSTTVPSTTTARGPRGWRGARGRAPHRRSGPRGGAVRRRASDDDTSRWDVRRIRPVRDDRGACGDRRRRGPRRSSRAACR